MKRLLPILSALFCVTFLHAQTCEPDTAFTDLTGVFPMPYDPVASPDGGIKECAYIGQPFEYSFTVGVGDSITIPGFGKIPLDSVVVVSVSNLPIGLNYTCDQTGCKFVKSSLGCAVIYGTPTAANTPGDYLLVITGKAFFPVFPGSATVAFPGLFFPGEYRLRLLQDTSEPCNIVSTRENLKDRVSISVNPNPATGVALIGIVSETTGNFNFRVVDLLGQVVEERKVQIFKGKNQLEFDGSHLPDGMYVLLLQSEQGYVTQKLTIQH